MEKQFTTPVSMKVTEQQFKNDLEQPLKEMGYKIGGIQNFDIYSYLLTNRMGIDNHLSNYDEANRCLYYNYLIETYNPKLFLALAGMTNSPDGNVGEWRKCVGNWVSFDNNNLYKQIENKNGVFVLIDKNGNKNHISIDLLYMFPKATKEEIIAFFSETETEVEQELIGYMFRNDEYNRMTYVHAIGVSGEFGQNENKAHLEIDSYRFNRLKELGILETFCEPVYSPKLTPISYEEAIEKLNENSKVKYTKKA